MSKAMSPGELSKGQYVTVLTNKPTEKTTDGILGMTQVVTEECHTTEFVKIFVDNP